MDTEIPRITQKQPFRPLHSPPSTKDDSGHAQYTKLFSFKPFRLSIQNQGGYFLPMPPSRKTSTTSGNRPKTELAEIFGRIVRDRRRELGLTQAELEGDEDFHQTYLSKLEIGKLEPRLSAIVHLEEKLQLPPGELIRLVRSAWKKDQS